MSAKGIQEVLSRAMVDTAFAKSLFVDAEKALGGYDLTAEELAQFSNLSQVDDGSMDESRTPGEGGWWNERLQKAQDARLMR